MRSCGRRVCGLPKYIIPESDDEDEEVKEDEGGNVNMYKNVHRRWYGLMRVKREY